MVCTTTPAYYMGFGDLNSGFHTSHLLNHFHSALKTDFTVAVESGYPSMDLSSLEWELAM